MNVLRSKATSKAALNGKACTVTSDVVYTRLHVVCTLDSAVRFLVQIGLRFTTMCFALVNLGLLEFRNPSSLPLLIPDYMFVG